MRNLKIGNLQLLASHGLSDEFLNNGPVSAEKSVAQAMKGETIIIMRLCSAVKLDYPEDIIVLVNALAQTGGLAIQNASMYLALQDDMKELKDDVWSHRSWF
ncbi:MAG: hypothetical protein KJP23_15900 [Deltaproteobacteria bacterium]|nr:hypothetical protein [Deltaproteobacteria bacterium]